METLKPIALPYAALGLGVGLLVDVTGVGGGSLMTPLLILLFGIRPVTTVGTDLLFAAATKSVGTLRERVAPHDCVAGHGAACRPACRLRVQRWFWWRGWAYKTKQQAPWSAACWPSFCC